MIRAHELARLLLAGPNAVVTTWDNASGCDSDVEQVVLVPGHRDAVLVLGLDIANDLLASGEVLYGDGPGIRSAVARHIALAKKAQGE